jgi:trk system potassium uptake protein TrkA
LAYRLYQQEHEVAIIDEAPEAFSNLHPDFRGRIIEGDGLAEDILRRAGIQEADGLAAVTNSDPLNVVVAHVARTVFRIPKIVVRNYDARWLSLHQAFDLPVVSSTIWGAQRIEELLCEDELRPLFSAGNGEVNLYEMIVPERWHGRSISELFSEEQCRLVALTRAGRAILPASAIRLEAGDIIHLSATRPGLAALRSQLNLPGSKEAEAN